VPKFHDEAKDKNQSKLNLKIKMKLEKGVKMLQKRR